jgi:hypothetical protein
MQGRALQTDMPIISLASERNRNREIPFSSDLAMVDIELATARRS